MGCSSSRTAVNVAAKVGGPTLNKEAQVEAALKLKRRYVRNNVFAEAVDGEKEVAKTPAMAKDAATADFIKAAIEANVMFANQRELVVPRVVEFFEKVIVKRGERLIQQGESGDRFYVVQKGTFEVLVDDNSVGCCGPGQSFGELALLFGAPRAASVVARTDAVAWSVNRIAFRATLAKAAANSKAHVLDALTKVELLDGLTDDQLEVVADAVQTVSFGKGERIITKNEVGNVFYMIQAGQVVCTDIGASQKFQDLTLGEGEYFGERALLTDQKRFANVTAKTDATLLALDREAFVQFLGPLKNLLDHNLSMRALSSVEVLAELSDAERRLSASLFTERKYSKSTTIINQGDEGHEFFIIKAGSARVEALQQGAAAPSLVKVLYAGDYFGEMALVNNDRRAATVVCETDCECFVLSRVDFQSRLGSLGSVRSEKRREELEILSLKGIHLDQLTIKAAIGSGTFGRVKLVRHDGLRRIFALKTLHKAEIVQHRQVDHVVNEKKIMEDCRHPFVLRLFSTFQDEHRLYFLLEFVQGGELFSVLHEGPDRGIPASHAKFYALAVCLALSSLHDKHIAYRDLKPENVMIDAKGYPKIVDFGFAKKVTRKTYTLCGTPEFIAPEVVLGRGHNTSIDWWAFGVLVYEMLVGFTPFADRFRNDQATVCLKIVSGKLEFPINNKIPSTARDLISSLLQRDPHRRLGSNPTKPVDRHPWFASIDAAALLAYAVDAPWVPSIQSDTDCSHFQPYLGNDDVDPNYRDDRALWSAFTN